MKTWIVVALVLGLTGCQSHAARADAIETGLDQEFALHGGQQAAIRDADLRLRFTDVLEDSRCPTDVGGYVIELRSLDPYPKTPDDSPALTDYSATLVARKVA